ncbi:MFS transporter [Metabacillus sp. GX 13764]|uniref:MFS transporter n=1 Tax=Metabacillus kandeliae TaxID=2900151 RepID=UPI001E497EBB|nr:MFS transporter [Metabacillus kandeliae]MCD7036520.1 MFS transporter [Metabacillus kandeliae]
MSSENRTPIWTKSFVSVFLINFFIFLAFYGLLTGLPVYVLDTLHRSDTEAGLVVTAFLLSAILVRPFSGKLLQDFGKKKLLIIGMILFMLTTFVYMLASGFITLLILRFIHGIWFSVITTATGAIAADVIPVKRRGEGLGYFGMSMNLAVVCGPFIALSMLQFVSFQTLFVIFGLILAVGVLFTFFIKVPVHEHAVPAKKKLSIHDLFETKALPVALTASIVAFSYASVISFISIYAKQLGLMSTASYFFVIFAVVMLISRPFVGRLFDTAGAKVVILPAFVFFAAGMVCLSFTHSAFMLLFSGALIGLGYGTLVPCFQTLAIQSADHKRSGHATATYFTLFDTGIAAGSYVLGIFAAAFGYNRLYFFAAILILLALFVYTRVSKAKRAQTAYEPGRQL